MTQDSTYWTASTTNKYLDYTHTVHVQVDKMAIRSKSLVRKVETMQELVRIFDNFFSR